MLGRNPGHPRLQPRHEPVGKYIVRVQEIDLLSLDDAPYAEVFKQGKCRIQQHGVPGQVDPDDVEAVDRLFSRSEEGIPERNYGDVVPESPERSGKLVDMCCDPPDIREKIDRKYALYVFPDGSRRSVDPGGIIATTALYMAPDQ